MSGSKKTSVGGYMAPTEGNMRLRGLPIRNPGADQEFVFQEFDQLLPWKTVKQNVMFALELNSDGSDPVEPASGRKLSDRICPPALE